MTHSHLIRIWRVTIDSHSAIFDSLDVSVSYLKSCLCSHTQPELPFSDKQVCIESEFMEEAEYRRICDEEDGVRVEVRKAA